MKLYKYQTEGVKRLLIGNCILADEMGLGKTVTALSAAFAGGYSQVTVICPLAAVSVWKEHICKVGGQPDFCTIQIVPYSRLAQVSLKGSLLIVDEAHYVKNRRAQRTVAVNLIAKGYKTIWLLTGTPYINHAADYWSLLHICYPKDFKSYWRYVDVWCQTSWTPFGSSHKKLLPGAKEPERFAAMLQKYVLRRTKEQVGLELPPVTEIVLPIEMTDNQKHHHKSALRDIVLEMQAKNWVIPNAAVAYTRARQIAIDPRILGGNIGSKIPVLADMCEEGPRVVVFSEFVEALKLANKEHEGFLYHGGLDEKQRAKLLDEWRVDPLERPLYMSRAAGGIALTLVESSTYIFLDEPWTPADREQAVARLVRIGQTKPVTGYTLRSIDSVEEHVMKLQTGKRDEIAKVHKYLLTGV
jgi:SNF2 family DNA or RNA helicase